MTRNQRLNIVITGATDGIGKAAALHLARRGARLLLLGRSLEKCKDVVDEIIRKTGNHDVESLTADLSSIDQVRRVAEQIRKIFYQLDVLIHSAGGTFPKKRQVTVDGLELTFAVQYLARFFLTEELMEPLRRAPDPRVISIAGGGTWSKEFDVNDLQSEKSYSVWKAIGKSSATNDLLTLEQTNRHAGICFYNCGPGMVRTKTWMADPMMRLVLSTVGLFLRTPDQAGEDVASLAMDDHSCGFYGARLKQNLPQWAYANISSGAQLWELSKSLVSGGS